MLQNSYQIIFFSIWNVDLSYSDIIIKICTNEMKTISMSKRNKNTRIKVILRNINHHSRLRRKSNKTWNKLKGKEMSPFNLKNVRGVYWVVMNIEGIWGENITDSKMSMGPKKENIWYWYNLGPSKNIHLLKSPRSLYIVDQEQKKWIWDIIGVVTTYTSQTHPSHKIKGWYICLCLNHGFPD